MLVPRLRDARVALHDGRSGCAAWRRREALPQTASLYDTDRKRAGRIRYFMQNARSGAGRLRVLTKLGVEAHAVHAVVDAQRLQPFV